jgi:hypothetical protein
MKQIERNPDMGLSQWKVIGVYMGTQDSESNKQYKKSRLLA